MATRTNIMTFELSKDELFKQWHRSYYVVEAESLEKAIELVKNDEVDPYDSEPIYEFNQETLEIEILNNEGTIIYKK